MIVRRQTEHFVGQVNAAQSEGAPAYWFRARTSMASNVRRRRLPSPPYPAAVEIEIVASSEAVGDRRTPKGAAAESGEPPRPITTEHSLAVSPHLAFRSTGLAGVTDGGEPKPRARTPE